MRIQLKKISRKLDWLKDNHYSKLIVLLILLLLIFSRNARMETNYGGDHVFLPFDRPVIPDTIPFRAGDSIRRVSEKQEKLWVESMVSAHMTNAPFGISLQENCYCEECENYNVLSDNRSKKHYCIWLSHYFLEKNVVFIRRAGVNMLVRTIYVNGSGITSEKRIRAGYRYADISKRSAGGALQINITGFVRILFFIFHFLLFIPGIYVAWRLFYNSMSLLADFGSGVFFTQQNCKRLGQLGWILVVFALLPLVAGLFFRLILARITPEGIYFSFWDALYTRFGLLITGLIILLIRNAVKRGLDLQQEQELTV